MEGGASTPSAEVPLSKSADTHMGPFDELAAGGVPCLRLYVAGVDCSTLPLTPKGIKRGSC